MDKQNKEIDGVEVCDRRVETGGKRPRKSHQPITAEGGVSKMATTQEDEKTNK